METARVRAKFYSLLEASALCLAVTVACQSQIGARVKQRASERLIVYFNFPHVIAAYNREFVPYRIVADKLKPDSPAAHLRK